MKMILTMVFLFSISTYAGNSVENGGDSVVQEFTNLARLAVKNLSGLKLADDDQKNLDKIKAGLESVQVSSQPTLFLDKKEVNAINVPSKMEITVSRHLWKDLKNEKIQDRIALVLHEYLDVIGLQDQHYALSNALMHVLTPKGFADYDAQNSYLKMASDIQALFWTCAQDEFYSVKEGCLFAGQVKSRVQILNQFTADHPGWFRSGAVDKYMTALTQVSEGLQAQCKADLVDHKQIETFCSRGEDQSQYLPDLVWK
jgi:hypothetical protein